MVVHPHTPTKVRYPNPPQRLRGPRRRSQPPQIVLSRWLIPPYRHRALLQTRPTCVIFSVVLRAERHQHLVVNRTYIKADGLLAQVGCCDSFACARGTRFASLLLGVWDGVHWVRDDGASDFRELDCGLFHVWEVGGHVL